VAIAKVAFPGDDRAGSQRGGRRGWPGRHAIWPGRQVVIPGSGRAAKRARRRTACVGLTAGAEVAAGPEDFTIGRRAGSTTPLPVSRGATAASSGSEPAGPSRPKDQIQAEVALVGTAELRTDHQLGRELEP